MMVKKSSNRSRKISPRPPGTYPKLLQRNSVHGLIDHAVNVAQNREDNGSDYKLRLCLKYPIVLTAYIEVTVVEGEVMRFGENWIHLMTGLCGGRCLIISESAIASIEVIGFDDNVD